MTHNDQSQSMVKITSLELALNFLRPSTATALPEPPRWPRPAVGPAHCPAQLLSEHSHATTVATTFRSSNGVPSDHSPSVCRDTADHVMEC